MEHRIGTHSVRIDGDTATVVLVGDLEVEQTKDLLRIVEGMSGGTGFFFVCADVGQLHGMPPEARRLAGGWKGIARAGGTAIIGATVITRTLVMLVSRASALLSNTRKNGEVAFFKTEEEALIWLASRRDALTARTLRS